MNTNSDLISTSIHSCREKSVDKNAESKVDGKQILSGKFIH